MVSNKETPKQKQAKDKPLSVFLAAVPNLYASPCRLFHCYKGRPEPSANTAPHTSCLTHSTALHSSTQQGHVLFKPCPMPELQRSPAGCISTALSQSRTVHKLLPSKLGRIQLSFGEVRSLLKSSTALTMMTSLSMLITEQSPHFTKLAKQKRCDRPEHHKAWSHNR